MASAIPYWLRARMKDLEKYLDQKIEVPLIRHGNKQRIETLINEEALLLAKYLRDEKSSWTPRLAYTKAREMMNR